MGVGPAGGDLWENEWQIFGVRCKQQMCVIVIYVISINMCALMFGAAHLNIMYKTRRAMEAGTRVQLE